MTALEQLRRFHAELLEEARTAAWRAEVVGRFLAESERELAPPPEHVEYDRSRLDSPPRPVETLRRAPAEPHGDEMEIEAESLHVTDDGEKKMFKVKGGAFKKWGVIIWPEVLEGDFGIDADAISPGHHPFKYRVRILMDGDKPRKVVGLAQ